MYNEIEVFMLYTEAATIIAGIILSVAKSVGVPGTLLLAICASETKLTHVIALNDGKTHTFGICQVKHETAQMLGFKGTSKDLMRSKVNAEYAAKYLKYQLNRYNGNWCKATAAYNSGTYNPSTKVVGEPRNLRYIQRVSKFLNERDKDFLSCGERKVASNERTKP